MIRRSLLLCAIAITAIASLSTQVTAFATAPTRALKGASSTTTSHSALYAVKKEAKKAATKKASKKAASKKKSADDVEVVNFKKAEFVSAVSEKTGMTKAESEMALAAVLNVIATVSGLIDRLVFHY